MLPRAIDAACGYGSASALLMRPCTRCHRLNRLTSEQCTNHVWGFTVNIQSEASTALMKMQVLRALSLPE